MTRIPYKLIHGKKDGDYDGDDAMVCGFLVVVSGHRETPPLS